MSDSKRGPTHPFYDDPECVNVTVAFAKRRTFKERALASFPGKSKKYIDVPAGYIDVGNKPYPIFPIRSDKYCDLRSRMLLRQKLLHIRFCIFLLFKASGNTWMRFLIEGATGIFTGSEFNDK